MKTLCMEITIIFMIGTGCATYGALEEDYGKSYNMAKNSQILNPKASQNLNPTTGLSGAAADVGTQKYLQSFGVTPAKPGPKSFVVPIIPSTGK